MRAYEFLEEPFEGLDLEMEFDEDEIWVTARDRSGRELGHVLFVDTGDELVPQDLEVEERFRGQGIARVMYDWVKSKGYRIRRSNSQTRAGAEFWNKYKPGKNVWEHIVESRSADLYHGTSLEAAEQILQSNTLRPGDSSHGDEGNVSLTRDFGVALNAASWQEPAGVVLVLDQQGIMHRSRLRPFDWGGGSDEAEEISRKPITGINKIIRKIIVLRHDEFDPEEFPRVLEDPRTQIVDQESVPEYSTARQFDRQQGVAEGSLNEYRDRLLQYVRSLLPTWPEYVLKDWLVPNKGDFSNLPDTELKNSIMEKLKLAGLTPNTKWQLVPNMKFTMDMFEPMTTERLIGRAGGHSDMGLDVPRDKERHAIQAALAQQQGGIRKEPVLLIKTSKGYELLEGWHRTIQHFAKYPQGYTGPAYVAVAQGQQGVAEGGRR